MKIPFKTWFLLAAVAASMALTGCVAVMAGAAGAGTVAYLRGELDAPLDASYPQAVSGVDRAIKQLEFARISDKQDALTAIFIARTAEDKKITIKVTKVGDQTSKVAIRVGWLGDESLSLTILSRIKANV
jgi:Protein of unknown function (DUF3568)